MEETKKKFYKRWWFWVIVVIVFFIVVGSMEDAPKNVQQAETQTKPEQKVEAIKLAAETLRQAYKSNEVNGDNLYKGKLVEISGTVDTIGKDVLDEAYVTFETNESVAFDKVQCMFNSTEENSLAQLKKGQALKVQGTVSGVSIGSVIVRNCKII
ncbi:MAG: hypothetical protein WC870_00075 [Candidatus Paceibacterota bacterium]